MLGGRLRCLAAAARLVPVRAKCVAQWLLVRTSTTPHSRLAPAPAPAPAPPPASLLRLLVYTRVATVVGVLLLADVLMLLSSIGLAEKEDITIDTIVGCYIIVFSA